MLIITTIARCTIRQSLRFSQAKMRVQLLILIAVFSTVTAAVADGECNPGDLKGLMSFKAGIRLDTSGRLARWVGPSCCRWEGISCDNKTGRVIEINLSGFITGADSPSQSLMEGILSPSITSIGFLEVLDLGGLTNLAGEIPPSIGFGLKKLRRIYLYGNKLTGQIPDSIGKLLKLTQLHLQENRFSGSLPPTLGYLKSLTDLHLHSNHFTGSIPASFTNLTKLARMDLHGNHLTGSIPEKIGNLKSLKELDLSNNLLSGKIPASTVNLTAISVMYLDSNHLEGAIPLPESSGQILPLLGFLRLNDNRLSGKIPSSFGYLVSLQRVSLANNNLEGPIPSSLSNLTSLTELYLDGNRLSGHISPSIGQLSNLLFLNISGNLIRGSLPPEMSGMKNLQTLDLSFNHLNLSTVPSWLPELASLSKIYLGGCGIREVPHVLKNMPSPIQELDLSANYLTGSLPVWLGTLSQLYFLNLSSNFLVSTIPDSVRSLGDLGVLDLHSNKLTGKIDQVFDITSRFPDGSLTYVDLSDNRFSGGIEKIGATGQMGIQFLNLSHNFFNDKLPASLGKLEMIRSLDFSRNRLGFNIPQTLANANQLETLKLQKNKLTGRIPTGFLKLKLLKELDLSDNLLEGEIPAGKPLSDFPASSFSRNKGLCGKPLPLCKA